MVEWSTGKARELFCSGYDILLWSHSNTLNYKEVVIAQFCEWYMNFTFITKFNSGTSVVLQCVKLYLLCHHLIRALLVHIQLDANGPWKASEGSSKNFNLCTYVGDRDKILAPGFGQGHSWMLQLSGEWTGSTYKISPSISSSLLFSPLFMQHWRLNKQNKSSKILMLMTITTPVSCKLPETVKHPTT